MERSDGGSVFPSHASGDLWTTRDNEEKFSFDLHDGISKRDFFAGLALAGLLANSGQQLGNATAVIAYQYADAMLAEREKGKQMANVYLGSLASPRDVANPPLNVCRVIPVVQCTVMRRGNGTEDAPTRAVTQYFSVDGELLAESDPTVNRQMRLSPPFVIRLTTKQGDKYVRHGRRNLVTFETMKRALEIVDAARPFPAGEYPAVVPFVCVPSEER